VELKSDLYNTSTGQSIEVEEVELPSILNPIPIGPTDHCAERKYTVPPKKLILIAFAAISYYDSNPNAIPLI
jgi:hypothetical protein